MTCKGFKSTKELCDVVTKNWKWGQRLIFMAENTVDWILEKNLASFLLGNNPRRRIFSNCFSHKSEQKKKKFYLPEQLSLAFIEQTDLYKAPRPLTKGQDWDMMDLQPYITPIHHHFTSHCLRLTVLEDIGPLGYVFEQNS